MATPKSELLDLSATVLEKVAADLRDPNAPDTATVSTRDDYPAKYGTDLALFQQKVKVNGINLVVLIVPDPAPAA